MIYGMAVSALHCPASSSVRSSRVWLSAAKSRDGSVKTYSLNSGKGWDNLLSFISTLAFSPEAGGPVSHSPPREKPAFCPLCSMALSTLSFSFSLFALSSSM